jgi:hypothetical protein
MFPDRFPGTSGFLFDNRGRCHEMIKLTLRSGETFVADLSGAQYGYHDPLTTWQEYESFRILEILTEHPAPPAHHALDAEDNSPTKIELLMRKCGKSVGAKSLLAVRMLESMNIYMLEWLLVENRKLKTMWKMPESEFQTILRDLVDFLEWRWHEARRHGPHYTHNGRRMVEELQGEWLHCKHLPPA